MPLIGFAISSDGFLQLNTAQDTSLGSRQFSAARRDLITQLFKCQWHGFSYRFLSHKNISLS